MEIKLAAVNDDIVQSSQLKDRLQSAEQLAAFPSGEHRKPKKNLRPRPALRMLLRSRQLHRTRSLRLSRQRASQPHRWSP